MSSNSFNRFTENERTKECEQEIMNRTKPYHIDASPQAALELQFLRTPNHTKKKNKKKK